MGTVSTSDLDWIGFGVYISERRRQLGLTQSDLATALGQKQPDVSNYEKGARQPTIETLFRLADALKVNGDTLLRKLA